MLSIQYMISLSSFLEQLWSSFWSLCYFSAVSVCFHSTCRYVINYQSSVPFKIAHLSTWEITYIMHYTRSLRSVPTVSLETVPLLVWLTMALRLTLRLTVDRFLSPPGDRQCDVLGFVPAGIVSSSLALSNCSEIQATCDGCSPAGMG